MKFKVTLMGQGSPVKRKGAGRRRTIFRTTANRLGILGENLKRSQVRDVTFEKKISLK